MFQLSQDAIDTNPTGITIIIAQNTGQPYPAMMVEIITYVFSVIQPFSMAI